MSYITTETQRKERLEICSKCPDKIVFLAQDVCGLCKCPLSGKTLLTNAQCPAKKWPVIGLK